MTPRTTGCASATLSDATRRPRVSPTRNFDHGPGKLGTGRGGEPDDGAVAPYLNLSELAKRPDRPRAGDLLEAVAGWVDGGGHHRGELGLDEREHRVVGALEVGGSPIPIDVLKKSLKKSARRIQAWC